MAVSITGVAGPDGGTAEKPVGTVFMALASRKRATSDKLYTFSGNREQIRLLAVEAALELCFNHLQLKNLSALNARYAALYQRHLVPTHATFLKALGAGRWCA